MPALVHNELPPLRMAGHHSGTSMRSAVSQVHLQYHCQTVIHYARKNCQPSNKMFGAVDVDTATIDEISCLITLI